MSSNELLAIIPARGGSKGIPRKNIINLGGRPLISYSINAAKNAKNVSRVVVSTDDEEIANISRELGAEVPYLRDSDLSQDDSSVIDTVLNTLTNFQKDENYEPDFVVLLQPTSPFRSVDDIEKSFDLLLETEVDSVVSVCKSEIHPYWMKTIDSNSLMHDFIDTDNDFYRRQLLPPIYRLNGALYVSKKESLIRERTFSPKSTAAYVMSREKSVDIDEMLDLEFAEFLMRKMNE